MSNSMSNGKGLVSNGLGMVLRNKRYIGWLYLLNVLLALFGTVAFVNQAGTVLDHSLHADRLLHGFDLAALVEMLMRPEFGPTIASRLPAMLFALLFMFSTALFLPGVLQGYASTYRLPREDFFRACGRNLWRFIRLLLVAGIVMIPLTVAFLSQLTLLVLLIPRFWQRGIVVTYYLQNMVEPIAVQPFAPVAVVAPAGNEPVLAAVIPVT